MGIPVDGSCRCFFETLDLALTDVVSGRAALWDGIVIGTATAIVPNDRGREYLL
jgi:hypothetical protein